MSVLKQAASSSTSPNILGVDTTPDPNMDPSVAPPSPDMLARASWGEADWESVSLSAGSTNGWGEQEWVVASPKKVRRPTSLVKKTLSHLRSAGRIQHW